MKKRCFTHFTIISGLVSVSSLTHCLALHTVHKLAPSESGKCVGLFWIVAWSEMEVTERNDGGNVLISCWFNLVTNESFGWPSVTFMFFIVLVTLLTWRPAYTANNEQLQNFFFATFTSNFLISPNVAHKQERTMVDWGAFKKNTVHRERE